MSNEEDDDLHTEGIRIVGAAPAGDTAGLDRASLDPDDDPFASWFEPGAGSTARPVTSSTPPVGAASEEFHMPDWTEPPTGAVPRVVADELTNNPTVAAPVYRGAQQGLGDDFEEVDFDDLEEDHLRVGALDSDRTPDDEWDEFEEQYVKPRATRPVTGATRKAKAAPARTTGSQRRTPTGSTRAASPASGRGPRTGSGERVRARAPRPDAALDDQTNPLSARDLDRADGGADSPAAEPARKAPGPRPRKAPAPAQRPHDAGGVGGDRNLGQAVGVGVAFIAVGLACFFLGPLATMLLITVVIGIAVTEFFGAMQLGGYEPAGVVGLVATVGILWGAYAKGAAAYPIVLGLLVIVTLLWFLFVNRHEQAVMNAGATMFGSLYVGGLASFAALMVGAFKDGPEPKAGVWLLFAAVLASVAYDVAGYFIGRSFGATPLWASLRAASPNKTQEGMIGGVIVSMVVVYSYLGIAKLSALGGGDFTNLRVGLFSVFCAMAAPLGDLCESAVKRDLGVKDMSAILPGHGGIMDRFDALLFVLPVAYFVATTAV